MKTYLVAQSSTGLTHRTAGKRHALTADCATGTRIGTRTVYLVNPLEIEQGKRPEGKLCKKCFAPVVEAEPVVDAFDAAELTKEQQRAFKSGTRYAVRFSDIEKAVVQYTRDNWRMPRNEAQLQAFRAGFKLN